jgi:hypothetical protein
MAIAHQDTHGSRSGAPSRLVESRRHGRDALAEVVPIRPGIAAQHAAQAGTFIRIARVFASLRTQAAPGGSPLPPSSPAPRPSIHAAPDDAA